MTFKQLKKELTYVHESIMNSLLTFTWHLKFTRQNIRKTNMSESEEEMIEMIPSDKPGSDRRGSFKRKRITISSLSNQMNKLK